MYLMSVLCGLNEYGMIISCVSECSAESEKLSCMINAGKLE